MLNILIYGKIGGRDEKSIKSIDLARQIKAANVPEIRVHINSDGGSVWEAMAIANALLTHSARVVTYCDGVCASAAVLPFLAGDVRLMAPESQLMVHRATISLGGLNADELRSKAEMLDQTEGGLLAMMARRTNRSVEDLRAMLNRETWMTPEQAIAQGFATGKVKEKLSHPQMLARLDIPGKKTFADLVSLGTSAEAHEPRQIEQLGKNAVATCLPDLVTFK